MTEAFVESIFPTGDQACISTFCPSPAEGTKTRDLEAVGLSVFYYVSMSTLYTEKVQGWSCLTTKFMQWKELGLFCAEFIMSGRAGTDLVFSLGS